MSSSQHRQKHTSLAKSAKEGYGSKWVASPLMMNMDGTEKLHDAINVKYFGR
jgi:hypothetical protein